MNEQKQEHKDQRPASSIAGPNEIEAAMSNPGILKIYANGFTLGTSWVDATIIFQHDKSKSAAITLPFAALKGLYRAIGQTIDKIEKGLGQPLPDLEEARIAWEKNMKGRDNKPESPIETP